MFIIAAPARCTIDIKREGSIVNNDFIDIVAMLNVIKDLDDER
jgi:hypothetical protein